MELLPSIRIEAQNNAPPLVVYEISQHGRLHYTRRRPLDGSDIDPPGLNRAAAPRNPVPAPEITAVPVVQRAPSPLDPPRRVRVSISDLTPQVYALTTLA
jgi:hypothetical protein